MSNEKIYNFLEDVSRKIDKIEVVIHQMNDKLCKVEEKMELMNNAQPQTQVAMVSSISSLEDKIKLLNRNVGLSGDCGVMDMDLPKNRRMSMPHCIFS